MISSQSAAWSADGKEGIDCSGRSGRWKAHRADPNAHHSKCLGGQSDSFCRGSRRAGKRHTHPTRGWATTHWKRKGYIHQVIFLEGSKKSPSELLPRVHHVISLLKRWVDGHPSWSCEP